MPMRRPRSLTLAEQRMRRSRVIRVARQLGFVGRTDYQHVYSQTGGAQYARGTSKDADLLTVYAEAFERDADRDDFSLEAIIAHERGHQILARHPRIAKRVSGISEGTEEILASLIGAMIAVANEDRAALLAKAAAEMLDHGQTAESAMRQLEQLWDLLERLL